LKLIHHTLQYLAVTFLLVIGIWAVVFYINFLEEIYDSIDDELDNTKIVIIQKLQKDSLAREQSNLLENHYTIREIPQTQATVLRDTYIDSTLFMINEQEYEPVRVLKSAFRGPDDKFYELIVFSSMVEEDDLIEDLFYSLIWLYVILLASVLIINHVLLKRIWRPFYDTIERLKTFAVDRSDPVDFPPTGVTEFRTLNETISGLLERTRASFTSQKHFMENASHELQTPLAISINKLELLAEKHFESQDLVQEISPIIQTLERMSRLNKSLLLLARIENRDFDETSTVNINELTMQLISDLSDLSEFKEVDVSIHEEAVLEVRMNRDLASIMMINLLKNAILHNLKGGQVNVTINASQIRVQNTGNDRPLNGAEIFKRFYKEKTNKASTGLGLAIVRSIADYHGFDVRYEFNGEHAFLITIAS